jgi:tetratricopeptide (TPR) repeat protein
MADSDDAPSPGGTPPSGAASSPVGTPEPLPKAPRINPPTAAQRRGETSAAGPEEPVEDIDLEDLVAWARSLDGTAAAPSPPAEHQAPRSHSRRRQLSHEKRKFHKFDPVAAKPEHPPLEAREGEAVERPPDAENDPPAGAGDDDEEVRVAVGDPRQGLRRTKAPPRSLLSSLAIQGFIVFLMGASFYLGRLTLPTNPATPAKKAAPIPAESDKAPDILSAPIMSLLDQAIAAENAGDAKKATALFDQARHDGGHIQGLDYQLAMLSYHSGDLPSALLMLNRSLAEGENAGQSYGLRGMIANRKGPAKGLHDFEAGTQADPFDPTSFFYWGEALRRTGQPREALVHLLQASQRARSAAELATYQLKVRLTQIELGQDKEFAQELAAQMASSHPAPEWVLTAAALDMHREDYAAAAADLARAEQLMDRAALAQALRDYFFYSYADKPQLAALYAAILPPLPKPAPAVITPAEPLPTDIASLLPPPSALQLNASPSPGAPQ